MLIYIYIWFIWKTKSCHNVNFVVIGGIIGCHSDNLWFHQWWQSWHYDDFVFSVVVPSSASVNVARRYLAKNSLGFRGDFEVQWRMPMSRQSNLPFVKTTAAEICYSVKHDIITHLTLSHTWHYHTGNIITHLPKCVCAPACCCDLHWNGSVVILMKFSSVAALEVVTSSAATDENFIKMTMFLYPPFQRSWKGDILVSPCLSVRLSICGQNRVRSVSSTILIGSISYLLISSSSFACNARFTIQKFEILANF